MKHFLQRNLRALALSATLLLGAGYARAQTPTGYCTTGLGGGCGGNNITDVVLGGTTLNATGLTCTSTGGSAYTAYPATGSTTATLSGGNSYGLSVTTTGNSIISAWVDYNRNGQLEASEWVQVDFSSTANAVSSVSLNVPVNAVQGQTILRVRSRISGNSNGAPDACLSFGSGEAKDFIVTIGSPAVCPTASNATIGSITSTSASLLFTPSAPATGGYTVTTTPQGGTASTQTVTASPVNLTSLTPNTTYTISIVSNCAGGTTSSAVSLQFTTLPTPAANNECATATTVPVTATCANPVNGTVLGATQSLPPTTNCGFGISTANDVWFSFVASGSTQLITLNPRFGAVLDVRNGSCGTTTSQFCTTVGTTNTAASLVGGLTAGQTYFVRVYPSSGTPPTGANSTLALCITPGPTPPANDECATAIALTVANTCATPTSGTVAAASQSLPPSNSCGFASTANDVWFRFVAGATSQAIDITMASSGVVELRSGTCASTLAQSCVAVTGGTPRTALFGSLTAGQTYFLRVYSSMVPTPTGTAAGFTLCVSAAPASPANDDCAGALPLPVQFGTTCQLQTTGDNTAATDSGNPVPGCASYQGADLWYRLTVPASGTVDVKTLPPTAGSSITDTGMSIYSGTCTSLTEIGCNDDFGGTLYSEIDLTGRTPGEVLYVRVWAYSGRSTGLLALCALAPSNCGAPTAPAANNVTATTAQLTWLASTPPVAGATYDIEYGMQGFTPGTGTAVTGLTATSFNLTGLAPTTDYCFYVRQNCGATNGNSPYIGPTCFSTPQRVPLNNEPCGAIALGNGTTTTDSNVGATTSLQPGISLPACSPSAAPKDVWFAFTAAQATSTLTLTGTAAGMVRVYTAPDCANGPFAPLVNGCASSGANNVGVPSLALTGLTTGQRYYVAVSGYGSSNVTGNFTLSATNVLATRALANTDALLVYPNPTNTGQLTLRLTLGGTNGPAQLSLLNTLGQNVLSQSAAISNGVLERSLNTRGLAAGVYTLRLKVGEQLLTRKVVLE